MKVSAGFLAEFSRRLAKELGAEVSMEGEEDVGEGDAVFTRENFRLWQTKADELSSTLTSNEKLLLETQKAFDMQTTNVASWKEQFNAASSLNGRIQSELDKCLDMIADLNRTVADRDDSLNRIRAEIVQNQETHVVEVTVLVTKNNILTAEIASLNSLRVFHENTLAQQTIDLSKAKAEVDALTINTSVFQALASSLRSKVSELTASQANFDEIKNRAEFLGSTVDAATVELKAKDDELDSLRKQLATYQQGNEATYWQGQATFAKEEAGNLRKFLATTQTQVEALKKSSDLATQRVTDMSEKSEFYLDSLKTLTKENTDLKLKLDLAVAATKE
jgi:predicted  nucleic acid-binding Zn-ribbon protein